MLETLSDVRHPLFNKDIQWQRLARAVVCSQKSTAWNAWQSTALWEFEKKLLNLRGNLILVPCVWFWALLCAAFYGAFVSHGLGTMCSAQATHSVAFVALSAVPHTHLAHKLVHALRPLEHQVVLGWEGVIMCSPFHLVEILPVFYLKETHKEGVVFMLQERNDSKMTSHLMSTFS